MFRDVVEAHVPFRHGTLTCAWTTLNVVFKYEHVVLVPLYRGN